MVAQEKESPKNGRKWVGNETFRTFRCVCEFVYKVVALMYRRRLRNVTVGEVCVYKEKGENKYEWYFEIQGVGEGVDK